MKKDFKIEVKWQSNSDGTLSLRIPDQPTYWWNLSGIRNELGEEVSWYHHDIYKKLNFVYYDSDLKVFWLPSNKLYDIKKCRAFHKRGIDNYAFFFKSNFLKILGIVSNETGMSGFLPPGESLR